jgi:phage terminase small subunit
MYAIACNLAKEPEVAEAIKILKEELAEKTMWTRVKSMQTMIDVVNSEESRKSDVIAAVKVLNEMHGYNSPTKIDLSGEIVHEIRRTIVGT